MNTKLPFLFFIILLLIACKSKTTNKDNNVTIENISISNSSKLGYSIVDTVTYIPLVENDNFLFSSISKLIIKEDKILILDLLGSNSLLCFDNLGTFLFKVGRQGAGPGEYTKLWDFDVSNSNIYLYDRGKKQMLIYDLDGNFVKTKKSGFRGDSFKLLNNNDFIFSLAKEGKEGPLLVLTDNNLKIKKTYLSYSSENNDDKFNYNLFQTTGNIFLYNKSVNDTVYSFNMENGEMGKALVFDFGKRTVPDELKNSYDKLSEVRGLHNYIYFFETPIIVKNILIGQIFNGKNKGTLIYDMNNHNCEIHDWLPGKLDYKHIFLPISTNENQIIGWMDYEIFESLNVKPILKNEYLEHLKEGGRLLVFYHLNYK